MMEKLLSILIPTITSRTDEMRSLLNSLYRQVDHRFQTFGDYEGQAIFGSHDVLNDPVEIICIRDDKKITIGEKRELLYKCANSKYSWQIDDDDMITPNAVTKILKAIESGPGCITFLERCDMNGQSFLANHSLKYDDWADKQDGYDFVRTPFYKDVIRTDIARSVPFEHIRYGEDHAWARALKPHLKIEVHLDEIIYIYQHNSKPEDHNERYGIKT